MATLRELLIQIKTDFDGEGLKDANRKIGGFLKKGLQAGAVGAAGAVAAVGAAAAGTAVQAVNFADDTNAAMENFRQTTNVAQEELDEYKEAAKAVFAGPGNLGESIGDVAEAMATIEQVTGAGADEIENMTRKSLLLRDRFDKDVGESIDAVKVLMDEFGLTSDQAFDFLTKGLQDGLDRNGDFLDSIREYGNLFDDAGFDAAQFYSIMESGAEGGVLGTDKIADAVKEFGIRANEGTDGVREAFAAMGMDFDRISGFIASGDETWADYFDRVIEGLNQVEDPLERARLQTELFGTQAEDLGVSFTEGLSDASTAMEDIAGASDEAITENANLKDSFQNLGRDLMVALEPAAQELIPLLAEGIEGVGEFLADAQPIFTEFAGDLRETLGPAIEIIGNNISRIAAALGLVDESATGTDAGLQILKGTLDLIIKGIEGVAVASELLADAFEIAAGLVDQIKQIGDLMEGKSFGQIAGAIGAGLGFQNEGVIPGAFGQPRPIIAHGGEVVLNPGNQGSLGGGTIQIGGQEFIASHAAALAEAINGQRQKDMQALVDTLAGLMD